MQSQDMRTTDRVAMICWLLLQGRAMTTVDVAKRTGMTRQGAWYLMARLSRTVPLYNDSGQWRLLEGN